MCEIGGESDVYSSRGGSVVCDVAVVVGDVANYRCDKVVWYTTSVSLYCEHRLGCWDFLNRRQEMFGKDRMSSRYGMAWKQPWCASRVTVTRMKMKRAANFGSNVGEYAWVAVDVVQRVSRRQ